MSVLELETVICRNEEGIGRITLNRPQALNAWIRRLGDDMLAAWSTTPPTPRCG
jgi:enoyl-CoA hydratase/carnithine racemase